MIYMLCASLGLQSLVIYTLCPSLASRSLVIYMLCAVLAKSRGKAEAKAEGWASSGPRWAPDRFCTASVGSPAASSCSWFCFRSDRRRLPVVSVFDFSCSAWRIPVAPPAMPVAEHVFFQTSYSARSFQLLRRCLQLLRGGCPFEQEVGLVAQESLA